MNEESVTKLTTKLGAQAEYKIINGADHYYRGLEDELGSTVSEYVKKRMDDFVLKRKVRPDRKRRQLPRD